MIHSNNQVSELQVLGVAAEAGDLIDEGTPTSIVNEFVSKVFAAALLPVLIMLIGISIAAISGEMRSFWGSEIGIALLILSLLLYVGISFGLYRIKILKPRMALMSLVALGICGSVVVSFITSLLPDAEPVKIDIVSVDLFVIFSVILMTYFGIFIFWRHLEDDFLSWRPYALNIAIIFICCTFACMVIVMVESLGNKIDNSVGAAVFHAAIWLLVAALWLSWDVWRMHTFFKGKHRAGKVTKDDFLFVAVYVYLDVILSPFSLVLNRAVRRNTPENLHSRQNEERNESYGISSYNNTG